MPPPEASPIAITPQGVRDGEPAVLGALAQRRGPAVIALASELCEPAYVVRAAADGFARFRAEVAGPDAPIDAHPDALLLRAARRAALDLSPRGPDLGCPPALALLAERAEQAITAPRAGLLHRHLEACEHCRDLAEGLLAAEEAYRDAPDEALPPAQLAPIVAAMAAAAPLRQAFAAEAAPPAALHLVPAAQPDVGEPENAPDEPEAFDEPDEPEPLDEPDEPEAFDEPPPVITPAPTFRSAYYELPPLPPRERAVRTKRAARQARRAAGGAVGLSRRAGVAARKRLDRTAPAPPEADGPDVQKAVAAPSQTTATWQRVEEIEFPARPPLPAPVPRELAPAPSPPRSRARLGLPAHRPRELALPAGLLVVAVLVVLAVAGVFSGGDPSGSSASVPDPVLGAAAQSATSVSLTDAARLSAAPARADGTAP